MQSVNLGRIRPIYKGEYDAATLYNPLDFVGFGGVTYFCIQQAQGITPTNATHFQPVLDKSLLAVIDDTQTNAELAWSSAKIQEGLDTLSVEIVESGTKGALTQSFLEGQQESILLSTPLTDSALVSVTKEIPQTGVTTDRWGVRVNGANYDVEDSAYATTLTPSATTGEITLTLGAGAFTSADVGKTISGNGGVAVLTATDGSATVKQAFNDTSAIASGEWTMEVVVFDGESVEVSQGVIGYTLSAFSYDNVSFNVAPQDTRPTGITFNNDGTKMYMVGLIGDCIDQYSLTTAFDLSTSRYGGITFSVFQQDGSPTGITFNNDGTKLYMVGLTNDSAYQYSLSTAFDLSTISYDNVSLSVSSHPQGINFNNDGTKLYIVGYSPNVAYQYTLTTAFDISTADNSLSFVPQSTNDIAFNSVGTKMFTVGFDKIHQYSLITAFDLSTASYDNVSFDTSAQDSGITGLAFSNNGGKLFVVGDGNNIVYQYTSGLYFSPTSYLPAITNSYGQIDATFWTDINSALATDTPNGQTVNYALSTDGRMTFTVVKASEGSRNIVRDNAGTWEINTSATYAAETWTTATKQDVWGALSEAMNTTANTMPSAQLANATDADFPTTGDTLDLAIILYTDDATQIPSSQGATLNYDANVLNQGAINGTDYEWDQPSDTEVRIKALTPNNLKVRVV